MLFLLSPSKTQRIPKPPITLEPWSKPVFLEHTLHLINHLKGLSEKALGNLLTLNPRLAALNHTRYQQMAFPFTPANTTQALLLYQGDVYRGFRLVSYTEKDYAFAAKHLRIISSFYGMLSPLDGIQPYRLEMSTPLAIGSYTTLYDFWKETLTDYLSHCVTYEKHPVIINLASEEYSKAIEWGVLPVPTITCVFQDWHKGEYRVIGLLAKRARGMMADYSIRKQLTNPLALQHFQERGYQFTPEVSSDTRWVFRKKSV